MKFNEMNCGICRPLLKQFILIAVFIADMTSAAFADQLLHTGTYGTREPTVAIDPVNPERVAVSSLWLYSISTNFGNSWLGPFSYPVLPSTYFASGDPSFAFGSNGTLHYSYLSQNSLNSCEVLISQVNANTGSILSGPSSISTTAAQGFCNDKNWIAIDRTNGLYAGRVYAAWSEFAPSPSNEVRLLVKWSTNGGSSWSSASELANSGAGFPWASHVAVGPSGRVYVAWHEQSGWLQGGSEPWNPNGTSGRIRIASSDNGGATWLASYAFQSGAADVTFNVQSNPGNILKTDFWTQGSSQPWILPDPLNSQRIWVVAADDPDNSHGSGDDADVMIVESTNGGTSWGTPKRVDDAPSGVHSFFPTAAIDRTTGRIAVAWYDNRLQTVNAGGNWLFDVWVTLSDNGQTFRPAYRVSNVSFDPDIGTNNNRFPGPPPTRRMGEYFGVDLQKNLALVWTGNYGSQQGVFFDGFRNIATRILGDINGDGIVSGVDITTLFANWGSNDLASDLNLNGIVDGGDVVYILSNWTG